MTTMMMMMMIGNLLRVKDLLPTNGEDSSRARAYACAPHHLSIANTKKRPARDDPARRQKKRRRLDRKEREREREREKQKKSAHLLLVTTRIGRHYIRGLDVLWIPIRTNYNVVKIQRVVVLSSFESAKEL